MGLPVRKTEHHYTYREYRTWPEDERWELIDGVAYGMSSPTTYHQDIAAKLGMQITQFFQGKPCKVFYLPVDIFFPRVREQDEDDVDTVVQPDIVVVCDRSRIRGNGIWGAPDLAVEVLSPSTARKDLREKYDLYQRSGVKEYWVVDPPGHWVQQYVLGADGFYAPEVTVIDKGVVSSPVFPGLDVEVSSIWRDF